MSYRRNRGSSNTTVIAQLIIVAVLFVLLGVVLFFEHIIVASTAQNVTFIVESTEVKRVGESDKYLVRIQYVTGTSEAPELGDKATVEVKDRWTMGNFRSADKFFELKATEGKGQVWKGRIGGWRNGFFSWFPEIIEQELTRETI